MRIIYCLFSLFIIFNVNEIAAEVFYYKINKLDMISAVDLDSNKTLSGLSRVQYCFPYDSSSNCFESPFYPDFAFSSGLLDAGCGGQLFLSYFSSYYLGKNVDNIDTTELIARPTIDLFDEYFGPYHELSNYYFSNDSLPIYPLNDFFLIKTNKNNFAIFVINSFLPTQFDSSSLCERFEAIEIEWWLQDDGNFDQLENAIKNKIINPLFIMVKENNIDNKYIKIIDLKGRLVTQYSLRPQILIECNRKPKKTILNLFKFRK